MKYQRPLFLLLFFSLLVTAPIARGIGVSDSLPSIDSSAPRRLQVAVFDRPPYTYKDKSGAWTGLSIDLWGQISGRLGLDYDYVEVPLADVYEKLHAGSCDLALAIALSGEKAEEVEFTEPYLFSHGAVVTLHKSLFNTLETLHSYIWNKEVFLILFLMIAGMILFSLILLVAERKHQLGHFSGYTVKGFGSALWFSAVTMTTVGYGDKTPLSAIGRMITFFWMLVGVLLIALFTGTVASSITTAKIQSVWYVLMTSLVSASDAFRDHGWIFCCKTGGFRQFVTRLPKQGSMDSLLKQSMPTQGTLFRWNFSCLIISPGNSGYRLFPIRQ